MSAIGGVSALAGAGVGAYVIAVAVHNNTLPLFAALGEEKKYLYFLGALGAVGILHNYGPTSRITDALVVLSVVALAVRVSPQITAFVATLRKDIS